MPPPGHSYSFKRIFYLDLRSLAGFRCFLGVILFVYVLFLWKNLPIFVFESGILGRAQALTLAPQAWVFSFFYLSTGSWIFHLGMGLLLFSALLFTIGYRANLFGFIAWFLLNCLVARNILVWHSGDWILHGCLFWSTFLPVDARFAICPVLREEKAVFSVASVGLILQIFSVYFFAGLSKLNVAWLGGLGIYFVSQLNHYGSDFGFSVADLNFEVGRLVSRFVPFMEIFLALCLLIPSKKGWNRIVVFFLFFTFHLSLALLLSIDNFGAVCVASLFALIPSFVWDQKSISTEEIRTEMFSVALNFYLIGLVGFLFASNLYVFSLRFKELGHGGLVKAVKKTERFVGLRQSWDVFNLSTPAFQRWLFAKGNLRDGGVVDPYRGGKILSYENPKMAGHPPDASSWTKYFQNISEVVFETTGPPLADFLCRNWNEQNPDAPVKSVEVAMYRQAIPMPGYGQLKPLVGKSYVATCEEPVKSVEAK